MKIRCNLCPAFDTHLFQSSETTSQFPIFLRFQSSFEFLSHFLWTIVRTQSVYFKNNSMKTLIPALFAVLTIGSLHAQDAAYAKLTTTRTSASYHAAAATEDSDAYIKIKGRSDRKILLNWAPVKGAVSHYVLERSTDGHTFEEAGLFFTGDWDNEPEYFYTDKFRKPYAGPLYYRLRVVGQEGSVIYTPVTILNATVALN